jgi:hypothetical protein
VSFRAFSFAPFRLTYSYYYANMPREKSPQPTVAPITGPSAPLPFSSRKPGEQKANRNTPQFRNPANSHKTKRISIF